MRRVEFFFLAIAAVAVFVGPARAQSQNDHLVIYFDKDPAVTSASVHKSQSCRLTAEAKKKIAERVKSWRALGRPDVDISGNDELSNDPVVSLALAMFTKPLSRPV